MTELRKAGNCTAVISYIQDMNEEARQAVLRAYTSGRRHDKRHLEMLMHAFIRSCACSSKHQGTSKPASIPHSSFRPPLLSSPLKPSRPGPASPSLSSPLSTGLAPLQSSPPFSLKLPASSLHLIFFFFTPLFRFFLKPRASSSSDFFLGKSRVFGFEVLEDDEDARAIRRTE